MVLMNLRLSASFVLLRMHAMAATLAAAQIQPKSKTQRLAGNKPGLL